MSNPNANADGIGSTGKNVEACVVVSNRLHDVRLNRNLVFDAGDFVNDKPSNTRMFDIPHGFNLASEISMASLDDDELIPSLSSFRVGISGKISMSQAIDDEESVFHISVSSSECSTSGEDNASAADHDESSAHEEFKINTGREVEVEDVIATRQQLLLLRRRREGGGNTFCGN